MEEKKILIKENAQAELQLLKAQVHPHFLFNTLNNIYSFTLGNSPEAGSLVLKLKDTVRYMIYDCEAALVPLEKEIKMIEDYIGLEQVRYGKRLNLEVEIKRIYEDKLIAPLLLIPFVENSFKHGSSKMLQGPWIKLRIESKENLLLFQLHNSKPEKADTINNKKGIGLKNIQKRLELLYPNQYKLNIQSSDDVFSVEMALPLLSKEEYAEAATIKENFNTERLAYA
jgi:LytS/YehU family sensor histidine kinase